MRTGADITRTLPVLAVTLLLVAGRVQADSECGVKVGACHAERRLSYTQQGEGLVTLEHVRAGLSAGFFARWHGSSPLSLMAEVQYVQKGVDGFTGERVNCLCLPLLGRYDVGFASGSVYAAAGPRADVYLGSGGTHSEDLESVQLGADVVIGCQVNRVSVEGRYSWTPGRDAIPGGSEASGEVYQALIGWTFR